MWCLVVGCVFLLLLPPSLQTHDLQCGCTEVVLCPPNSTTTGVGATSLDDCVCFPGLVRIDANGTCGIPFPVSLPVALISGVSAGGGVLLVSVVAAWMRYRALGARPAGVGPREMTAGERMKGPPQPLNPAAVPMDVIAHLRRSRAQGMFLDDV